MVRNITHYEKRPIGKTALFSRLSVESDGRNEKSCGAQTVAGAPNGFSVHGLWLEFGISEK
jgi:hypothetical protein